jgi:hypothetical protein
MASVGRLDLFPEGEVAAGGVWEVFLVPEQAERKALVRAELLRCKRILDLALDGQSEVIRATHA